MWAPDPIELHEVDKAANEAVTSIRVNLCCGDELHTALVRAIGYGQADESLRVFLRRVQKSIERAS